MARTMNGPMARSSPPSTNGVVPHSPTLQPVELASPKHRKPSWTLAGVFLVILGMIAAAWVFSSTSKTLPVVVAGRDLGPGEVIQPSDLRIVELGQGEGLRAIQTSQQSLIIGKAARGPIPAGTVLNTDLFTEKGAAIPAGDVVVGAALEPGAIPTASLRAGDRIEVLGVVKTAGAQAVEPTASVLASGTVWSIERPTTNAASAKVWVSMLVPQETQSAVAQAAADGRLRLALIGAAG